jgi:hypothetical protein
MDAAKSVTAAFNVIPTGCLTSGDEEEMGGLVDAFIAEVVSDLWPGSGVLNKCAATKLQATGAKADGKLNCYVKAAKKGTLVDSGCLSTEEDQFAAAFAKAESTSSCFTTGDAAAIEAKVDAFVDEAVSQLLPIYPVVNTCAATKLGATGKVVGGILGVYTKAARGGKPIKQADLDKQSEKFDNMFEQSEMKPSDILVPLRVIVTKDVGTVTSAPKGINCRKPSSASPPKICSSNFEFGTAVTLTASTKEGYLFLGWEGDCTGTGACTLTMDGAHQASAIFEAGEKFTGSFTASGTVQKTVPEGTCTWAETWSFTQIEIILARTQSVARLTGNSTSTGSSSDPSKLTCLSSNSALAYVIPLFVSIDGASIQGSIMAGDYDITLQATRSEDLVDGTFSALAVRNGYSGSVSGPFSLAKSTASMAGLSEIPVPTEPHEAFEDTNGGETRIIAPPACVSN